MTQDRVQDTILNEAIQLLIANEPDAMKQLIESLWNKVLECERDMALQAEPYERSCNRVGYANGFKPKRLQTRMGTLELNVPQTRGTGFYPNSLEKGSRSERALKLAIAEMYLKGVSTRRVTKITEELCGHEVSSTQVSRVTQELDGEFQAFRERPLGEIAYVTLDALYLKVRHNGTVINQAILVGYGVNPEGRREFLGVSVSLSEAEVHWRDFLEGLTRRGLRGVRLITSDDHSGLAAALRSVFPSVGWQRCQFHMSQNAQHYAPKKHMQADIARSMRSIFNCVDIERAREMVGVVAKTYEEKAPEFVNWLDANIEQGFTCYTFPEEHRRRIRTSNGMERVNREVKRRTRVAVMFPNAESALRLVTGVLMEIHEEWVTGRQYLDMSLIEGR